MHNDSATAITAPGELGWLPVAMAVAAARAHKNGAPFCRGRVLVGEKRRGRGKETEVGDVGRAGGIPDLRLPEKVSTSLRQGSLGSYGEDL